MTIKTMKKQVENAENSSVESGVRDQAIDLAERLRLGCESSQYQALLTEAADMIELLNDIADSHFSFASCAIAWGWLWHVSTADDRVKTARNLLGQYLDKDAKRYGIQTAKAQGAQINVQEIEALMLRGEFGDA
jgi:hypothetical protein